jgi:hypothetical protein
MQAQYQKPGCDMASVQQELVALVDTVPPAEKLKAIGQLEMLVSADALMHVMRYAVLGSEVPHRTISSVLRVYFCLWSNVET